MWGVFGGVYGHSVYIQAAQGEGVCFALATCKRGLPAEQAGIIFFTVIKFGYF
jgi:hypothetical protein